MKAKILEMIQLQRALDERILAGEPYPEDKMRLALLCEVAEVLECVPSRWKHWKKSAVDEPRERLVEELVDVWHFVLSLNIQRAKEDEDTDEKLARRIADDIDNIDEETRMSQVCRGIIYYHFSDIVAFAEFLRRLGVTFDEIYDGYIKKNAENHARQDRGY